MHQWDGGVGRVRCDHGHYGGRPSGSVESVSADGPIIELEEMDE